MDLNYIEVEKIHPKDYNETLVSITESVRLIENKFKKNLNVGVCHPGSTNLDTGLFKMPLILPG